MYSFYRLELAWKHSLNSTAEMNMPLRKQRNHALALSSTPRTSTNMTDVVAEISSPLYRIQTRSTQPTELDGWRPYTDILPGKKRIMKGFTQIHTCNLSYQLCLRRRAGIINRNRLVAQCWMDCRDTSAVSVYFLLFISVLILLLRLGGMVRPSSPVSNF